LKSNIADNRKNLEVETLQRSNEHTEFEAKGTLFKFYKN
jgi:hypothetical protein